MLHIAEAVQNVWKFEEGYIWYSLYNNYFVTLLYGVWFDSILKYFL